MTSVRGCGRPCRERPSVVAFVAPSIAPLNSSPPLESGDKLSNQIARLSGGKPLANSPLAVNSVSKYSEDNLQWIIKAVLEARAPAPALAPVPALVIFEVHREKLKTRSLDLYFGKSHMDCYNFCQRCEDYFAIAGAIEPTQIPFAVSFLRNRISFCWQ